MKFLLVDDSSRFSKLLDAAMSFLTHTRSEVRQMSATVVYNLTLLCTSAATSNSGSTVAIAGWGASTVNGTSGGNAEEELPQNAVQVFVFHFNCILLLCKSLTNSTPIPH